MQMDAFTSGKNGGLTTKEDIRLLVCYMLSSLDSPIASHHVGEILQSNGLANYFEVMDSIGELIEFGHIAENQDNQNIYLVITDKGRVVAAELERRLPLTIREKSVECALALLTRIKIESENRVDILQTEKGWNVTCYVSDGSRDLMSLTLLVADRLQAESIRERFLIDPTRVYSGVLALQTGDYQYFGNLFD